MSNLLPVIVSEMEVYEGSKVPFVLQTEEQIDLFSLHKELILFNKNDGHLAHKIQVEDVQIFDGDRGSASVTTTNLVELEDVNVSDGQIVHFNVCPNKKITASSVTIDDFVDYAVDSMVSNNNQGEVGLHIEYISQSFKERLKQIDKLSKIAGCFDLLELPTSDRLEVLNSPEYSNDLLSKFIIPSEDDLTKNIDRKVERSLSSSMMEDQEKYIARKKADEYAKIAGDDDASQADEFIKKAEELDMPEDTKKMLIKEIKRFKQIPTQSSEKGQLENYIDTMLGMPWNKFTEDNTDIEHAKSVLDKEHHGMDKVKQRIVEYIAVRQLAGDSARGTVLCMNGPAGVGKTSIVKSMANALGRPMEKISLGGLGDPSQLKGHRKTYIGAMMGSIANAVKKAGTNNPVILLDEIDKIAKDTHKGSPEAVLLELLDPSQNDKFFDDYLNCEIDMSKVIFIATSNYLQNMSAPLRDRLEIVDMKPYMTHEKVNIAETHLIPRSEREHGLGEITVTYDDGIVESIVKGYTREGGVRKLKQCFDSINRKVAFKKTQNTSLEALNVDSKLVKEALGRVTYTNDEIAEKPSQGLVNGLYVSGNGGGVLPISCITTTGKGKINITGNMKTVMKESSQIAFGAVRKILDSSHENYDLDKLDIHLNAETATPKDGDSAGVTMVTAMMSAITGKSVRNDVAMTGAITLRGTISAVGGIPNKLIGAYEAGVKTAFVPKANEKDLEEVPEHVKKSLDIRIVENVKDILDYALV